MTSRVTDRGGEQDVGSLPRHSPVLNLLPPSSLPLCTNDDAEVRVTFTSAYRTYRFISNWGGGWQGTVPGAWGEGGV